MHTIRIYNMDIKVLYVGCSNIILPQATVRTCVAKGLAINYPSVANGKIDKR